eukprot:jgi/Mesvir1/12614/Mv21125-RA.1
MEDNNSSSSVLPNAGEGGPPRLPPPRLATSPPLGRHAFGLVPVARVAHSAPVNDPVPVQPVPGGWPLPPQHGPEDPGARPAFDGAGGGGVPPRGRFDRTRPPSRGFLLRWAGLSTAVAMCGCEHHMILWPPPCRGDMAGSIGDHERDGDFFGYEADALYTEYPLDEGTAAAPTYNPRGPDDGRSPVYHPDGGDEVAPVEERADEEPIGSDAPWQRRQRQRRG